MTTVNIILWVIIAVHVVALIAILTVAIRGAMIRRQRKERLAQMVTEAAKSALYGPKPPSFATHYLLNEGFLLLIRKPDQSLKLTTPAGGENLLACFTVDHHADTPILINGLTNERVAVDSEFINHWLTTN